MAGGDAHPRSSPRDVAELRPQAGDGCGRGHERLTAALADGFSFAIVNFANPDMVGHTGSIPAAVRAVETVDACLGRVVAATERAGGVCLVTADHGNAEQMLEIDGASPYTAHTTNPVPLSSRLPVRRSAARRRAAGSGADSAGFARPARAHGDDGPHAAPSRIR